MKNVEITSGQITCHYHYSHHLNVMLNYKSKESILIINLTSNEITGDRTDERQVINN